MKYAWIEKQRDPYTLEALCTALGVSASGFADWKRGGGRHKRLSDAQLLTLIRAVHGQSKGAYGSPRVWRELKHQGVPVSRERVARLMRDNAIRAKHKRRYKATTDSKHDLPVAPNLLDRQFTPERPDQVWTADITYIPTAEGWLYLAVVMDLYTRMIVGWSMGPRMTRDLVIDALRMAYFRRRPKRGLMHHSDRGSQYASQDYQALLEAYGMIVSMSRKANCWDNAPMESFFHSLKTELVMHCDYKSRDQARASLFDYMEVFYNRQRRHSTINYVAPLAFEASTSA